MMDSFFVLVRLEGVKSAEPPMAVGSAAFTTSRVISEALRVAMLGFSALNLAFSAAMAGVRLGGISADSAVSKESRKDGWLAATRASHDLRSSLQRAPAARHAASRSAGTSKGG